MRPTNTDPKRWPVVPAAAALAGIIVFIFASFGPPASSSGFVAALKGLFLEIAPRYAAENPHYASMPGPGSWLMAFVLGMAAGGFLAARTGKRRIRNVPEIWARRFGPSPVKRYAATFVGGFLILFGARLAGGCTLGLFMSGSIQMAVSGLLFGAVIFATAMFAARLVYGKQTGRKQ